MHDHCGNCGFKYKVEPNFFFGAMFVSYAVLVLTGVITFLIARFIFESQLKNAFIAILVCLFLLMPIITILSRNIYINIFVNYDKNASLLNQNHSTAKVNLRNG